MKQNLLICTLVVMSVCALAQRTPLTIKGRVVEASDNANVVGALVVLNAADSLYLTKPNRFTTTDAWGTFTLKSSDVKNNITISFTGMKPYFVEIPTNAKGVFDLGDIKLAENASMLGEVVVSAQGAMANMKGDTLQFNASSFKTNPDATAEDLLKKMPGVSTDADGSVKSQGQKITKVYVDGKEFDDDPATTLKSLPADVVESMQMFDDKSDDAKFSGFDDGDRIRAMNIVTKSGVSKSIFGKAYAGYGTDQRYSLGAGMNIWNGDHRWSITATSNNVNNQGFTLSDISASGAGMGRGYISTSGMDVGAFTARASGGIIQSNSVGVSYNGQFEKLKMSANYGFTNRDANQASYREQEYLTMDRYMLNQSESRGIQTSHSMRVRTEWTPNETNRIRFNPYASFTVNHGWSQSDISNSTSAQGGSLINRTQNGSNTKLDSWNIGTDLWWQTVLGKPGRVLSVGGTARTNQASGDRFQLSPFVTLDNNNVLVPDTINQIGYVLSSGYALSGSISFSEQLSRVSRVSANYRVSVDNSKSDKEGLNWDAVRQMYNILDTTTSNNYVRNYVLHTGGVAYSYNKDKKVSINVGADYQWASGVGDQSFPVVNPSRSKYFYTAFLPNARLNLTPKQGESLMLRYSRRSNFPSVTQLQDVMDVSNPLAVSKGNPNLEQSYINQIVMRYNLANTRKNTNFSVSLNASHTDGFISMNNVFLTQDSTIKVGEQDYVLKKGTQYSTPINLNGMINTGLEAMYYFGIRAIKSNLTVSASYNYRENPSIENNVQYKTNSHSFGGQLALVSNVSENVDFTLRYMPSVSLNTVGTGRFDRYFTHNVSAFVNVFLVGGLYVNVDATWKNSFGTQQSYSQHYGLLNAHIGYKFLDKRQAEFKISGYDLLQQARSFTQGITDTYLYTSQNNILQRYFMLSFTYKFDTRKGTQKSSNAVTDGQFERRRGDGMGAPHTMMR